MRLKMLALVLVMAAGVGATSYWSSTVAGHTLSTDTTLASGSRIKLTGNLVSTTQNLTIQPNVIIATNGYQIQMTGTGVFSAVGSAANPVTFTSVVDSTGGSPAYTDFTVSPFLSTGAGNVTFDTFLVKYGNLTNACLGFNDAASHTSKAIIFRNGQFKNVHITPGDYYRGFVGVNGLMTVSVGSVLIDGNIIDGTNVYTGSYLISACISSGAAGSGVTIANNHLAPTYISSGTYASVIGVDVSLNTPITIKNNNISCASFYSIFLCARLAGLTVAAAITNNSITSTAANNSGGILLSSYGSTIVASVKDNYIYGYSGTLAYAIQWIFGPPTLTDSNNVFYNNYTNCYQAINASDTVLSASPLGNLPAGAVIADSAPNGYAMTTAALFGRGSNTFTHYSIDNTNRSASGWLSAAANKVTPGYNYILSTPATVTAASWTPISGNDYYIGGTGFKAANVNATASINHGGVSVTVDSCTNIQMRITAAGLTPTLDTIVVTNSGSQAASGLVNNYCASTSTISSIDRINGEKYRINGTNFYPSIESTTVIIGIDTATIDTETATKIVVHRNTRTPAGSYTWNVIKACGSNVTATYSILGDSCFTSWTNFDGWQYTDSLRNAFSTARFISSDSTIWIHATNNNTTGNCFVSVYHNHAYDTSFAIATGGTKAWYLYKHKSHALDTITVLNGVSSLAAAGAPGAAIKNTAVDSIWLMNYNFIPYVAPSRRMVLWSASVGLGFVATNPNIQGEACLVRNKYDSAYGGRVSVYGGGWESFYNECQDSSHVRTFAVKIDSLLDGTAINELLIDEVGNDYVGTVGGGYWSKSSFQQYYTYFLTYLHTIAPNLRIYAQSQILSTTYDNLANSTYSQTLLQYDSTIGVAATGLAWVKYIDGHTLGLVSGDLADGVHPTTAGQTKLATNLFHFLDSLGKLPHLAYATTPLSLTTGTLMTPDSLRNTGGAYDSVLLAPALPTGLSYSKTTGLISGTPSAASAQTTYTATAYQFGASAATTTVTITVAASGGGARPRPRGLGLGVGVSYNDQRQPAYRQAAWR